MSNINVKIDNRINIFASSARDQFENAIRASAVNVLIASKQKAPFDKGGLRSDTATKKVGPLHWRISYYKEYARFQEFGGDGKRVVRRYKTSGTGKKYLSTAGNNEVNNLKARLAVYAKRAKA